MGGCGLIREPSHKTATPQEAMHHRFMWSPCQSKHLGTLQKNELFKFRLTWKKILLGSLLQRFRLFWKISARFFFPWNKRNILLSLNCYQVCNASSSVEGPTHMEKTHSTKYQMYNDLVLFSTVISTRWFYIWPWFAKHKKISFKYIYF